MRKKIQNFKWQIVYRFAKQIFRERIYTDSGYFLMKEIVGLFKHYSTKALFQSVCSYENSPEKLGVYFVVETEIHWRYGHFK